MNSSLSPLDSLGEPVAKIQSTSERFQLGVLAVVVGGSLLIQRVCCGPVSGGVLLATAVGATLVSLLVCFVAKKLWRLGTQVTVCSDGMQIMKPDESNEFLFDHVTEFTVQQTDHYGTINGVSNPTNVERGGYIYVGGRAVFEIGLTERLSPLRLDLEYHKSKASHATVQLIIQRLSESVERRLARDIDTGADVPLADGVSLTRYGFRLVDPQFGTERRIPFEEMGSWKRQDKELVFFSDSGTPFLRLPLTTTNLVPAMALVGRLCDQSARMNETGVIPTMSY